MCCTHCIRHRQVPAWQLWCSAPRCGRSAGHAALSLDQNHIVSQWCCIAVLSHELRTSTHIVPSTRSTNQHAHHGEQCNSKGGRTAHHIGCTMKEEPVWHPFAPAVDPDFARGQAGAVRWASCLASRFHCVVPWVPRVQSQATREHYLQDFWLTLSLERTIVCVRTA